MKYVNHMSSSVEDEKHEALIEKCGMEGYGAYWVVAEKIAAQIRPECVSTSLTLSWRNWARHLRGMDVRSVKHIVRTMADVGLILLKIKEIGCTSASKNDRSTTDRKPIAGRSENELVTVDMPNILKYADEYTRKLLTKSRQTPDKLRSDTGFPAVPALPEQQDLTAGAPLGGSEAPGGSPKPTRSKSACQHHLGCSKRGTIKSNGRWYCSGHDPEASQQPIQAMK
jgi:Domain of unknown function (DUF4373)